MSQTCSCSRPRTAPTSRPARRATSTVPSAIQARTSSYASVSASIGTPGLACMLLHPAGALEGQQLSRVGRLHRTDLEVADGGRVQQVGAPLRRTAAGLVARQAAIRAWSPESSTSGTSCPRQLGGLV